MLSKARSITVLSLLVFLFTGACSLMNPRSVPPQPNGLTTYDDPFQYCAAVGRIDTPDARYSGPSLPDSIIKGMIAQGIITADTPAEFQKNAVWRCMDSHVWVCHFGANIPCQEKADTSKTPTTEMENFCQANPDAIGIPAAVTGRATVYEWRCNSSTPEVGRQLTQVDPQGYLAVFWHELVSR
jgi:hypothetical protein